MGKINKIRFNNSKGEEFKTSLPDEYMNKVYDLMEQELKDKEIFYIRNDSKFNVKMEDVDILLQAQVNANNKLISEGVITREEIIKDIIKNF
jgi:hypothetical protein